MTGTIPLIRPIPSYSRDAPTLSSASATSDIPYAIPQNGDILSPTRRRPSFMSPPPPPVEPPRTRGSIAERLRRYRELAGNPELPSLTEARQRLRERYTLPSLGELSPVIVRPTLGQLLLATRTDVFSNIDNAMNTECPITRESFSPNDSVLQILQCRHVFSTNAAVRWFEENTRCPVCRHDVREPLDIQQPLDPEPQNPEPQNPAPQNNTDSSSSVTTPMDIDEQINVSDSISTAQSIARYLSESIDLQLPSEDGSGSVMIEYGFVVPNNNQNTTYDNEGTQGESDSSSL